MKKFLSLLTLALVFYSCSKNDDSEPEIKITTYQVISNVEKQETTVEYLDGTMYEVVVFKFIGDDLAGEDSLDPIAPGKVSNKITISEDIEKIKLSFKFVPRESSVYDSAERRYLASYTFINKNSENKVVLKESSMLQSTLKIASQSIKEFFGGQKLK